MDSTIPAPFHKYLYSGACYIQMGQCYAVVDRSFQQGLDLQTDKDVCREILGLWNNFVEFQLTAWKRPVIVSGESTLSAQLEQIEELGSEFTSIGESITQEFIAELIKGGPEQMNLNAFFKLWATTCSDSYATFIRSDSISRLLDSALNSALEARARH